MAITDNQLTDIFQNQLGRAPTKFEVSKYANSSIQSLAGLKNDYGKLNTSTSVSDYLQHIGEDNSLEARTALGKKYGITNVGTAAGNEALLAAVKKGPPPSTTTAPVNGTVQDAAGTTPPVDTTQTTPPAQGDTTAPVTKYDEFGVAIDPNNAKSTDNQPPKADAAPTDPIAQSQQVVDQAYAAQQSAQQAVAEIDKTLAKVKQDKMDEIARAGGVVNEASLQSEILRENEPLLAQRKELVAQYTQANQAYQKALSDKKDSDANFYKQKTLDQNDRKITDQENQFTQKLTQSGYKQTKVNVYDEYGNVTGQQIIWSQNPSATTGFDSDGNPVNITQGSQGAGITPGGTPGQSLGPSNNNPGALKFTSYTKSLGATDSGIKASDGGTFASFPDAATGQKAQVSLLKSSVYSDLTVDAAMKKYSNGGYGAEVAPGIPAGTKMKDLTSDQMNQLATDIQTREGVSGSGSSSSTIPLYTGSSVNAAAPGYTTSTVKYGGKDTQLTQSYIDKIAIAAIMNGGVIPSSAARGTKGLPIVQTDAIKARIGQLDPGGNLVANKAAAKAWGDALTKQITYTTNLSRALSSADADFKQILDTYQNAGINDHDAPIANLLQNAEQYNLGNADVAAFRSSLAEVSRLYSQVFSNGGQTTDATNKTAQDILNGNMSFKQLQAVQAQLQALGKIDVQKANDTITGVMNNLSGIGGGDQKSTPSTLNSDVQATIQKNLTFSDDGKTAYLPRSVWAGIEDKDAVLKEAQDDGLKLLING